MDFDKYPLGTAFDMNALVDPGSDACRGRGIVAGDGSVFEPKPQGFARKRERPGDHQQAIVVVEANACSLAVLIAAALREVANRPINLIDLVGLTGVRRRRKR